MSVIYPFFLSEVLQVNQSLENKVAYPFFDPACQRYEALRSVAIDGSSIQEAIDKFRFTEYEYRKSVEKFEQYGVYGLIGINAKQIIEPLDIGIERMIYVLKKGRPYFPATKMHILLRGFNLDIGVDLIRHHFASYGLAQGTKEYRSVDFEAMNLKTTQLKNSREKTIEREKFLSTKDKLQSQLEVFRTLDKRGVTGRYGGSVVSFEQYKKYFLSFGLLGLIEKARPGFRNSKLGYREEGLMIFSKIQKPENDARYYQQKLQSKNIEIDKSSINKIFKKWKVKEFKSHFIGNLQRLLLQEDGGKEIENRPASRHHPVAGCANLDSGYLAFIKGLDNKELAIANPGVFLFLPYLEKLQLYDKVASLLPEGTKSYDWFTLLMLNTNRILSGIESISKACNKKELSIPLSCGLINMPCNDSILNGLSQITEDNLLELRKYLALQTRKNTRMEGKRIAFDFSMRDYSGEDVNLKNIGKGPSPKRKICFPGFRPHIAWDVTSGIPIVMEFRNGTARATTTIKRFIKELIQDSIGIENIEHIYIDSEYTAEHIWKYITDKKEGIGAELTMCVKQNKKVKKYINSFLETNPKWIFYDEKHTFTSTTFSIPVGKANLRCVLKKDERTTKIRCFGSTIEGLDAGGILEEYKNRWGIENGIKDLTYSYFFDKIPGIDPHRVNIHYYCVNLAKVLFEMLLQDYNSSHNYDNTKKTLSSIRPEFISSTNAIIKRDGDILILKWIDLYPKEINKELSALFNQLNLLAKKPIKFLGGLKMKFEIAHPRPEEFKNSRKKITVNF
jgi:hypothetical protein